MNEALAWIGQIIDWLGRFIPRWIIFNTTEGGVKFVRGKHVVRMGPGIHWYWPLTTTYMEYPIARQADNLPTQTIETLDGVTVVVSGMLVYEVTDVEQLLTTVHSAIQLVQDVTLTAIHDVCCKLDWATLKEMNRKGTLDTQLKNKAQGQLEDYGVKVIKCMLTDLARARVVRLIQSTSRDSTLP